MFAGRTLHVVIERLSDLPDDVIGFRMSGHVTRDEYTDVILPVFRERLRGDDGVRTLVVIDEGFEKFEPGALWEDLKLGLGPGIAHLSKWKRTALVSDAGGPTTPSPCSDGWCPVRYGCSRSPNSTAPRPGSRLSRVVSTDRHPRGAAPR